MADLPPLPPPAQGPSSPQQPGWAPPPPGYPSQPPTAGSAPQGGDARTGWTQVGYGYGETAAALQPLGSLGTVVSVLVGLTSLLCVAAALALFSRASLLGDPTSSLSELLTADDRAAAMVGAQTLATLATGIAWMTWQYRLAKNLTALGRPLRGGAGRAVWGWFIPIANYFIAPHQLLRAAQATDEARGGDGVAPVALVPWWIAFGVGSLVLGVGSRVLRPSAAFGDVDDLRLADQVHGAGLLLLAVAGVLAILTVRACTARQMGDQPAAPVVAPPPTTS
jgi:hypothetical protein